MGQGQRPCQEQVERTAAEFGPRQTSLWRVFFLVVDFLVASSAALGSITWGGLGIALLWSEYRMVLICSLYGVLWNKGVVYL